MRRIDFLKIKRGDNLGDPEFWNRRLEDIDLRIANNEDALQNVDAVANRVEALALDRMNNVLVPLTEEAFNRLTSVATLFGATSSTTADIAVGTKSFIIDQGKRNTFAPLLFIVVFPAGDTSRYMAGRTVSYDVATGTLVVDVSRIVGDGSASAWEIAPIASVDEIEGYANSAADDALATAADRLAVSTDKGIVAGDRSAAQTARTEAQTARNKAQKWADESEDVAVDAGKYSAKHHAAKAEASASAAALDAASISPGNLLHKADNLSDIADADTAIENLGATTVGKAVFKAADQAAALTSLGLDSILSDYVALTGDEIIEGVKTFSSVPVGPASDPTTANQLARKAYVDSKGGVGGLQAFTSSGTFTIPAGVTKVKVIVTGGGGGGGSYSGMHTAAASGGGAGGTAIKLLTGLTPGKTLSVTVGAGGGADTGGGSSSVSSGTETISTVAGSGGAGGTGASSYPAGAGGGGSSGADFGVYGGSGGGGGASGSANAGGHGGASYWGGGAPGGVGTTGGYTSVCPGSGGGGAAQTPSAVGGSGRAGIVVFQW